jgi:hypothetical protein
VEEKNENKGGNDLFDDKEEKKKENNTSCYIVRVLLRICALAGMGILRIEKTNA